MNKLDIEYRLTLPAQLFLEWLPALSGGEVKVLLAVLYETVIKGRQKMSDSPRQLAALTGLSPRQVSRHIKSLLLRGILVHGSGSFWITGSRGADWHVDENVEKLRTFWKAKRYDNKVKKAARAGEDIFGRELPF